MFNSGRAKGWPWTSCPPRLGSLCPPKATSIVWRWALPLPWRSLRSSCRSPAQSPLKGPRLPRAVRGTRGRHGTTQGAPVGSSPPGHCFPGNTAIAWRMPHNVVTYCGDSWEESVHQTVLTVLPNVHMHDSLWKMSKTLSAFCLLLVVKNAKQNCVTFNGMNFVHYREHCELVM